METPRKKQFYGAGIAGVVPDELPGHLLVFEGGDGCGRTTQAALLQEWLERLGFPAKVVGLKESALCGEALDAAMSGHTLCPITMNLFYATDFADQHEKVVIPALRAGFTVISDAYIYTLMARAVVRGIDPAWVADVYGIALVPDLVFYLDMRSQILAERALSKGASLNFWEAGMDVRRSGDMYDAFIEYQSRLRKAFQEMSERFGFINLNGNQPSLSIAKQVRERMELLLGAPDDPAAEQTPSAFTQIRPNGEKRSHT